jgi:PAS domain-containing protein
MLDYVHPEDLAATVDELRQLASGKPSSFEGRWRAADGRYRWLRWAINPVPEEKLLYAVAHDITDRREDEEKLKSAYAFRKAMGESLVTGIRAIDLEGRIIFVNPAFCRMIGWSEQELVGCRRRFPTGRPRTPTSCGATSSRRWPARPRRAATRCASCTATAAASTCACTSRR